MVSNNRKRKSKRQARHRQRCEKRNRNARSTRRAVAKQKHGRTKAERRETKLTQPATPIIQFDFRMIRPKRKAA